MNSEHQTNSTRLPRPYHGLILLAFLLAYLCPLGARPLMLPDETRYGAIPQEMLASGDWISPHLNGARYFEKPVLGYWVHAISILVLGHTHFALRLPSALSAGLAAVLIGWLVRRAGPRDDSARLKPFLAALVFLTSSEVYGVATTAILDSLLTFLLTATIVGFYFATEAPCGSGVERRYLLLSGAACGLAFLTKGFLALAVPVLTLAPYVIWERRYREAWRLSAWPLLAATLVALPWSIAIHLKEPDFWHEFFWNEHVRRFLGSQAQHGRPFWYFAAAAPALFMPWTFLVPAAWTSLGRFLRASNSAGRLVRLSVCWLVMPFLFFSASSGKLLTYILPCFPPLAILMAFCLTEALKTSRGTRLFQRGVMGFSLILGLGLVIFPCLYLADVTRLQPYESFWKSCLAMAGVLCALVGGVAAWCAQSPTRKTIYFGLSPVILFSAAHFLLPDQALETKTVDALVEGHQKDVAPDTIILSDKRTFTAVCWYLRRSDVYLLEDGGELDYGLAYKESASRLLDLDEAARLIQEHPGRTVLVGRVRDRERWRDRLPQPVSQDDSGPKGYYFWQF